MKLNKIMLTIISKSLTLFGTTWSLILRVVISAPVEMPYILFNGNTYGS